MVHSSIGSPDHKESAMTLPWEDENSPDAIAAKMASKNNEIAKLEAELAPLTSKDNEFEEELAKLRQMEANIKAARMDLAEAKREKQWELRRLKREAESAERQYVQATAVKKAEAEYKTFEDRWNALTIGSPWREWAKDHQIKGAHRMAYAQRMILADGMGLGKTLTSIATCDMIYNESDQGGKRVLYLCPAPLLRNVVKEWRRWNKRLSPVLLGGQTRLQRGEMIDVLKDMEQFVVVLNYEAWRRDKGLLQDLVALNFDTVIIDEAHNLKDTKSQAYAGVKTLLNESNPKFVFPMTGTPILNKPEDIFSLLTFVDPGMFYSKKNFLYDYCVQEKAWDSPAYGKWKFQPGGLDRLAKRISNRYLRRTKEQAGIQLPPLVVNEVNLELSPETHPLQYAAYQELKSTAMIMLDKEEGKAITTAAVIALYTRLRQMITWPMGIKQADFEGNIMMPVNIDESVKVDACIVYQNGDINDWDGIIPEVVYNPETKEGERVVVFSQFVAPLEELHKRCQSAGIRSVILNGDTPADLREKINNDFDRFTKKFNPDYVHKWDVVLCHYRVGGVGLNFTDASQMIILDEEWNPGKRDQAYGRLERIGQERSMTVHLLLCEKTIDDWMHGLMLEKEKMVDGFNASINGNDLLAALKSGLI